MAIQSVFASSVINRLDTEPPTPPTNVHVAISPSLQAKINWTASTDDTEITYYKVLRDNVELGTVYDATSFTDFHIEPDTTYTYVIKAYDLVLKEAASEPFVAVSPGVDELIYFPFSGAAISTAFHQLLLKYRLEAHPSLALQWIMEWKEEYESSANSLMLLALVAAYDPDYLGPDGATTVTERALEHICSVIAGGNEPGIAVNGLSEQGYAPVLEAFTIAKLKAPSISNELTTAEKEKLDIMMKGGGTAPNLLATMRTTTRQALMPRENLTRPGTRIIERDW